VSEAGDAVLVEVGIIFVWHARFPPLFVNSGTEETLTRLNELRARSERRPNRIHRSLSAAIKRLSAAEGLLLGGDGGHGGALIGVGISRSLTRPHYSTTPYTQTTVYEHRPWYVRWITIFYEILNTFKGNAPSGMPPGGDQSQNPNDKDKPKEPPKKKWEPPLPTRVGRKKRKGPAAASKLPAVFPTTRCRLKLLKQERIKDYLLLEEEFIQNQERLRPEATREEKNDEERSRVDDLRGSPMAVGTMEEIIDDDHAIVSTASGPENYVSIMSFVDKDMLEPGCQVLLHHKTQAIVGVLQDDTDPLVNVMKLDKAPNESYADIGGLETQIQEIKVPKSFCVSIATY
jgi:Proteasomal ATPase OB C-terminal domain